MADQLGHITLGGLPTLIACALILLAPEGAWHIILVIAAALAVSLLGSKERVDFRDVEGRAGGIFPLILATSVGTSPRPCSILPG